MGCCPLYLQILSLKQALTRNLQGTVRNSVLTNLWDGSLRWGSVYSTLRPKKKKKKKKCLPFPDRPKIFEDFGCFFFVVFFIYSIFALSNKIVKIKVSKYIVAVPKVNCVGTEGICLPYTCLHQIVWCHLFKYRKTVLCISLTSRFRIKFKKIIIPTYLPSQFSGQKSKQTFIF